MPFIFTCSGMDPDLSPVAKNGVNILATAWELEETADYWELEESSDSWELE